MTESKPTTIMDEVKALADKGVLISDMAAHLNNKPAPQQPPRKAKKPLTLPPSTGHGLDHIEV